MWAAAVPWRYHRNAWRRRKNWNIHLHREVCRTKVKQFLSLPRTSLEAGEALVLWIKYSAIMLTVIALFVWIACVALGSQLDWMNALLPLFAILPAMYMAILIGLYSLFQLVTKVTHRPMHSPTHMNEEYHSLMQSRPAHAGSQ
jgi:hypothetical protein